MSRMFKNKGLQRFFETGDKRGIQAKHAKRIGLILARLAASSKPEDMQLPGLELHALSGNLRGFYAVSVSGNRRIIFQFIDGQPANIDLLDYH